MKGADGFVQAYNAQAAVESTSQLIVAQAVTQEANDKQQVVPMVETIEQQAGQKPEQLLADSGYCSDQNLEHLEQEAIDAYVATGRQKHGEAKACARGPLPKGAKRVDRMRRKLQTQSRGGDLCGTEVDRRTGFRADQTCAGIQTILPSGN